MYTYMYALIRSTSTLFCPFSFPSAAHPAAFYTLYTSRLNTFLSEDFVRKIAFQWVLLIRCTHTFTNQLQQK